MSDTLVLNARKAQIGVQEIRELVESAKLATDNYRSMLEDSSKKTNLKWVSAIVKEAALLTESTVKLNKGIDSIQESIIRYTNAVEDYSDDTTGL